MWRGTRFRSRVRCGALAGAGFAGILLSLGAVTGLRAEPEATPPDTHAAAPLESDDSARLEELPAAPSIESEDESEVESDLEIIKELDATPEAAKEPEAAQELKAIRQDGPLGRLAEELKDENPDVRRAAVNRYEDLGAAAASLTPAVVELLADPDLLVRACATRAALRAGLPAELIVAVMPDLLDPERLDVLRLAALILVEIGPDAQAVLPKLHDCLQASSVEARLNAAEAALRIAPTDRPALVRLLAALRHPQADVRFFAANCLGAAVMDSDLAVLGLQRALTDRDPKVATAAALHLARAHEMTRQHLPEYPLDLEDHAGFVPCDVSPWIVALTSALPRERQTAAICLMISGSAARAAVPELLDRLGDRHPVVQLHAAQALWEIEHKGYSIIPVLLDQLLTNRGETRIGAIFTLGRMGSAASDALPWLKPALRSSKSIDRLLLAEAILRIEPTNTEARHLLVRGVYSRKADVRYLSTVALASAPLSIRAAVEPALYVAADDRSSRVRTAAYETLSLLEVRDTLDKGMKPARRVRVVPAGAVKR